jgi:serine/threonine-protein kinase
MIGQTVSHYRILEELGGGGMGVVYKAEDAELGRLVALKFLPQELAKDPVALERFRREARAASALDHPSICTIFEIGEHQGQPFIAMQCLEGETLRQRIAGKPLKTDELLDLAIQIAQGLEAAHAKGVVHRDIKPANLFITTSGHVKILDFGLAKLARVGASGARPLDEARIRQLTDSALRDTPTASIDFQHLTSPGVAMGTVAYMSPEQARGEELDARTDLFSFGAVLYEMATGRPAFDGATSAVIFHRILAEAPQPPLALNPTLPPKLEEIINKALEKDRNLRYQHGSEMRVDLERLRRASGAESALMSGSGRAAGAESSGWPTAARGLPPSRLAARLWQRLRWWCLAIVPAVLAGGIGAYLLFSTDEVIHSVAVLPFANASGNPNDDYLSGGITESIIDDISQLPNLRVTARSTVSRFRSRDVDPQEVGRKLNVGAVLTGTLTRRGDTLAVQADLVNVRDGSEMWGEHYDRKLNDMLAIREDIAREIVANLRFRLSSQERRQLAEHATKDPEAYDDYLKGLHYAATFTPQGLQQGIEYFRKAIERDPTYALPYSGMAYYYGVITDWLMPANEAGPRIEEAAKKALQLDDTLAEGHVELATAYFWYTWDWPAAEREFRRALELNPNLAIAHAYYGWFLVWMGRTEEGLAEHRQALALDPLSSECGSLYGADLYSAHRYDEAVQQARATLQADPNYWLGYDELGSAYLQLGQAAEAKEQFRKARQIAGAVMAEPLASLGYAYGVSGEKAKAQAVIRTLADESRQQFISPFFFALVNAGLGDKDRAFAWLEKAYQERSWYLASLKCDPKFDSLRADPRFQELLRRVGLPQ